MTLVIRSSQGIDQAREHCAEHQCRGCFAGWSFGRAPHWTLDVSCHHIIAEREREWWHCKLIAWCIRRCRTATIVVHDTCSQSMLSFDLHDVCWSHCHWKLLRPSIWKPWQTKHGYGQWIGAISQFGLWPVHVQLKPHWTCRVPPPSWTALCHWYSPGRLGHDIQAEKIWFTFYISVFLNLHFKFQVFLCVSHPLSLSFIFIISEF